MATAPQNRRKTGVKNAEKGQFKPGQSGNPGGRPKTATFAEEVRHFLREQDDAGTERLRTLLEKLCEEDPKAALQFLCSYAFGKPAERLDVSATGKGRFLASIVVSSLIRSQRQPLWQKTGASERPKPLCGFASLLFKPTL